MISDIHTRLTTLARGVEEGKWPSNTRPEQSQVTKPEAETTLTVSATMMTPLRSQLFE